MTENTDNPQSRRLLHRLLENGIVQWVAALSSSLLALNIMRVWVETILTFQSLEHGQKISVAVGLAISIVFFVLFLLPLLEFIDLKKKKRAFLRFPRMLPALLSIPFAPFVLFHWVRLLVSG